MSWRPDYCTTPELAAYLRVGDSVDDVQLGLAITAASRAIDRTCKRQFGQTTLQPRIYTPRVYPDGRFVVDVDDVQDTTGAAVDIDWVGDAGFATVATSWSFGPTNATATGDAYEQLFLTAAPVVADSVRVTALFGWTAVPDTIRQACLLQASRVLARRDSPFGISGSPDSGGELRLLAKVDVDVAVMLRPYTRRWFGI